eukprot:jgi/Bigna1/84616/fgenesh1_pg.175_\
MKRSGTSDAKRKLEDDERIPSRRSSKAQEIQAKEAELKETIKKFEEATQGEKRKSISDYERGSETKGKRFKIDADAEEFFQALRDTPFTEGTTMQLVRITKNILVPGHRASWIRGSKHLLLFSTARHFQKQYADFENVINFTVRESRALIAVYSLGKVVALKNDEKVAFYSVPEGILYCIYVENGTVNEEWKSFDSRSTHLVVDPENGFGHLNVNVTKAFVVVASSPNKEWKPFEKLLKAGTKKRDLTLYADVIQEDEFHDISAGSNESGGADGDCTVEDLKSRSEIAGGILRHIVDEQKFKKFQGSQDHMVRKFQGKIGENVEMIQPRDVALPSSVFCIRPILEDGSHTSSDFVLDFLSPYVESRVVGALAEEQSKQSESMSGLEAERRWFHLIKNGGNFEGRHVGSHLPEELKGKTTTVSFSQRKRVIHHRENSKEEKNKCLEEIRELKDSSTLVICPPNYTNIDGASSAEVLHQMAKGNVRDFKVKHKDEVLVDTKVVTIYCYTLEKHYHTFRVNFVYKDVSKSDQEAWKKTWHKHLRFVVVKLDPVRFWGKLQEALGK